MNSTAALSLGTVGVQLKLHAVRSFQTLSGQVRMPHRTISCSATNSQNEPSSHCHECASITQAFL
eukprot:4959441-Amphidinium_carterae.1